MQQLRAEDPPKKGQYKEYEWRYLAANALHGWDVHLHNTGGVHMQISRDDFMTALKVIEGDSRGVMHAHGPAKSPHRKG